MIDLVEDKDYHADANHDRIGTDFFDPLFWHLEPYGYLRLR